MCFRYYGLESGDTLIQVYTGDGKGKTTAALGLALRAAGAGFKVYIAQFVKGRQYSELNSLKKIKNVKVEQFGRSCFIKESPVQKDIELAKQGFERIKNIFSLKKYNVIILDELNIALMFGLLKVNDILDVLKKVPRSTEVIITGRYAHPEIIKMADLVSEIKQIKHYFNKGIKAREGIEF